MNLAESLLTALKDHGARQIFGIPGDFVLPFFKVVEESAILPLYTLSHEPALGFAADAAARFSSALGVAAVTYGAGALNMVNAVASAYAERSPLVVISGGPDKGESASGLLLHHQAKRLDSQLQINREITCDQTHLDDAARAPVDIARVLARQNWHWGLALPPRPSARSRFAPHSRLALNLCVKPRIAQRARDRFAPVNGAGYAA